MEESVISDIKSGKNVLVQGPGGTGKTTLICKIAKIFGHKWGKDIVAITATTGVAAVNISGTTLHSFAGIGLATQNASELAKRIMNRPSYLKKWQNVKLLIIDEISMLGGILFQKIHYISQTIRQNKLPFGGIQLLLCGDFLQLPPVKDIWIFETEEFNKLELYIYNFTECMRYDNHDYFHFLSRIREGNHTEKDIEMLKTKVVSSDVLSTKEIKPTILYSTRIDVSGYNDDQLNVIPNKKLVFECSDMFEPFHMSNEQKSYFTLMLDEFIPQTLVLKIGAQVMLKKNIDVTAGLINGSRGVVTKFEPPIIWVKFINGTVVAINEELWEIESLHSKAVRRQYPLILAWAMTIHKSQGSTLDCAVIDLGKTVFSPAQAYVALSRLKSSDGLHLIDFDENSLLVDEKSLKYCKSIIKTELVFLPQGTIKVGRIKCENGKRIYPEKEDGYKVVEVMTKCSKYASLSPHILKDSEGRILENIWQFSKVYKDVPNIKLTYSRFDNRVIWSHSSETHIDEFSEPNELYVQWRLKGFANKEAVRYPAGYVNSKNALYSINEDGNKFNYIEARKNIYIPLYNELVKNQDQYKELKEDISQGKNLLIIEVDGPHQESLQYYKDKYNVEDDFIIDNKIICTSDNLKILLEDDKHSFGHGYCLAASLLDISL